MRLHDLFPGSFASEHFDTPQTFTIKGIAPIVFKEDDEEKQKGKMTFLECSNYWIFGKEAAGMLAEQIGSDETDNWVGHRIELYRDKTPFRGKIVDCVRGRFADADTAQEALPLAAARGPQADDALDSLRAEIEALKAAKAGETF